MEMAQTVILTAEEMREVDQQTMAQYHVPGMLLMEAAALAITHQARQYLPSEGRVLILVGPGNNGGDGWAVARQLHLRGYQVEVLAWVPPDALKGDAQQNARIAEALAIPWTLIPRDDSLSTAMSSAALDQTDLVIDALLGTGSQFPLRADMARVTEAINGHRVPVLSVDLPTGLDADTGRVTGATVRASMTVTLGALKPGLLLEPGHRYVGQLVVEDLGLPRVLLHDLSGGKRRLVDGLMADLLPQRSPDGHKGAFGQVCIVGGSPGLTGAPVLSAEAALRSGAGTVVCAIPDDCHAIVAGQLVEAMTLGLPTREGALDPEDSLSLLRSRWQSVDALAIGPGLGRSAAAFELVRSLLRHLGAQNERPIPFVLDADGLNAMSDQLSMLRQWGLCGRGILTPHPGEMARLLNVSVAEICSDRVRAAQAAATQSGCVVVLKGAPTLVAHPDGKIAINSTGNVGLATGGSGDVLTGIIGAFLAEGVSPWDAARLGCFLHGRAADLATATMPPRVLLPRDVIQSLGEAIATLEGGFHYGHDSGCASSDLDRD